MSEFSSTIEVEMQALEIKTALSNVEIATQEGYNEVVRHRVEAAAFLKKANEFFDGPIKNAHDLHKQLLSNKKQVTEPVETSIKTANQLLLNWDKKQEAIRREAQIKLEQEARARAEAKRIQEAELLQAAGASEEAVEAVLEAPVIVTEMVVAEKTYETSKAVVYRDNYSGEVTDLKALVKHIAKNPSFINLIQVNQTAVNQLAKSMKDTLDIPGIKVVNNKVVASGRG